MLVALIASLLAASPAAADHGGDFKLTPCVAPASPADDVSALFSAGRFDCATHQPSFGTGDFWIRMDVPNPPAAGESLGLRFGSVWMDGMSVHVRYADGHIAIRSFSSRDITGLIRVGAIIEVPIEARAAPVAAILVRMEGAANLRGLVLGPVLFTREQSHAHALGATALYTFFIGLCLALLVYNFVLWLTLRHRFQLFYCAMILATMGYAFTSSGAAAFLFDGLDNNDRLRINYLLLGGIAVTALQFIRNFFEPRVMTPWLKRAVGLSCIATFGTALAFALFAPWQIKLLDRAYFLSFVLMLCVCGPLLASAWRNKSQFLSLFLIAWSAPIVVTILRALHGLDLVGYSFWLDNGTMLAMGFESLLSSLVIAYRIKLLSDERDLERAEKAVAQRLASVDPLTGLLNRRAFLQQAIGTAGRQRLLLVDIDHFKRINDTLGHVGGDAVLKAFALALRKWAPEGCLVVRLGGEEFGLLLPQAASEASAASLLERIRSQPMPHHLPVTASIGEADGPLADQEAWIALYRSADIALYRAKSEGRDRACHIDDLALGSTLTSRPHAA
ncbi:MAG: diguanylate cyclase domain-containing protein [Allosphingosinicella sp.]|uniref:sensor domain-containing diguanylate cyclase n=1 Tax=Allosphingosinicella sp. TaxID=2823234 RepID=UPI00393E0BB1